MARRSSRVFEVAFLIATGRPGPPGVPPMIWKKALKMIYRAGLNVPQKPVLIERAADHLDGTAQEEIQAE